MGNKPMKGVGRIYWSDEPYRETWEEEMAKEGDRSFFHAMPKIIHGKYKKWFLDKHNLGVEK